MERNNSHDDQQDPQILADHVNNQDSEEEYDHEDNNDHYDTGDGFLVDEEDDDEQSEDTNDEDNEDEDNLCLDEDDYSLVQENKTFKRLRKSSRQSNEVVKTLIYDEEDDLGDFIVDEDDDDHGVKSSSTFKKRKYRQGTDSNALRFANELFGDPEEFLKLRREMLLNENVERKLEDEFEPSVVVDKYMTDKDEEIRKLDVPERMQVSGIDTVDEVSFEEESDWIYTQLGQETVNKDDIKRFLEMYHVKKFEVPFIAMYRKEQCRSLLESTDFRESPETTWHKVLWTVHDLDKKWLCLRKRKNTLLGYYTKRFDEENRNVDVYESIVKSLKAAESEREVDDVDSKFNLYFPKYRKSKYSVCDKLAKKFGYSAEQLGLALSLEKVNVDELDDAKETPEDTALHYVCELFKDAQDVLKGGRHVSAVEISCEPSIKKYVRGIYMDNVVISTCPTQVIDSSHRFWGVERLREKPLSKFDGTTQWLLIKKAEEEKLLQVTFTLPKDCVNKLINEFNECYLSVGVSKSARLWNEQRRLILEEAVHGFLLPLMEKEARLLLTSRAKERLVLEYGNVLWNKVSSGPYRRNGEIADKVLSCCWRNTATVFVMLDSSGEMVDVLYGGSIGLRYCKEEKCRKKDHNRLKKFIKEHKPNVVCLGAANLNCIRLKDEIYEVIFEMVPKGEVASDLPVVYVDESLPRLYENSSEQQLPQRSGIVKRAVALGRYLQNPLAMVAGLCGPGKEILSWKLHALQEFLDPDEKYEMVEKVMVDVTNQVGVDVNLASRHEWLFSPLQFVSGLGPRKALSLQKSIVSGGLVLSRKELINHGLGKNVFINAAGFLRIRRSGVACNSNIDLLDDTRIHPESYSRAQELTEDVYEQEVMKYGEGDVTAIEHVREHGCLRKVVLHEYLSSKKRENEMETYVNIMRELTCGFKDWRSLFKEASDDELFYMLSGETEETMREGRVVQVTVRKVTSGKAVCVLDCGLTGFLTKEDYADNGSGIVDLSEKLCEGDIVTCKIKGINTPRYLVFLVCKESVMRKNTMITDDYYYHEEDRDIVTVKKVNAPPRFKSRMIVHPRFMNISDEVAKVYLSDKDIGECIVRPSSRGLNHLTLMVKIYDNVYAHKEIIEGGKEKNDALSLQRIGKTLQIGNEIFEDLDEVMDRYVDPLVTHVMTMINYRKFKNGTKTEIDDLLQVEKAENPTLVAYGLGVSYEHPGSFILFYIRCANPHHEYIGLYPSGFKFRKIMFEDLDKLVSYFKRHVNDDPMLYHN